MKIDKFNDFIVNEGIDLSMSSFKSLLNKVGKIIPKKQINEFILNNKNEIESVRKMVENENGDFDYNKALNLVKKSTKT